MVATTIEDGKIKKIWFTTKTLQTMLETVQHYNFDGKALVEKSNCHEKLCKYFASIRNSDNNKGVSIKLGNALGNDGLKEIVMLYQIPNELD